MTFRTLAPVGKDFGFFSENTGLVNRNLILCVPHEEKQLSTIIEDARQVVEGI